MVKRDGTNTQDLTDGLPNSGFPSWSPDGKKIVYRVWGGNDWGLRILNVEDRSNDLLKAYLAKLLNDNPIIRKVRNAVLNFKRFMKDKTGQNSCLGAKIS